MLKVEVWVWVGVDLLLMINFRFYKRLTSRLEVASSVMDEGFDFR